MWNWLNSHASCSRAFSLCWIEDWWVFVCTLGLRILWGWIVLGALCSWRVLHGDGARTPWWWSSQFWDEKVCNTQKCRSEPLCTLELPEDKVCNQFYHLAITWLPAEMEDLFHSMQVNLFRFINPTYIVLLVLWFCKQVSFRRWWDL